MNDSEGFFGINRRWGEKTHVIHICQTGSMQLWMALELMANYGHLGRETRPRIISVFPYDIEDKCKCRNCRYQRWRQRLAKLEFQQ